MTRPQTIAPRRLTLAELLADEAERGHVERDTDGDWRLAPEFEAEYGQALRDLSDDEQTPAGRGKL